MRLPTPTDLSTTSGLQRIFQELNEELSQMTVSQRELLGVIRDSKPIAKETELNPEEQRSLLGLTELAVAKHNYTATAAPTTGDNLSQGYGAGSQWVVGTDLYICINSDYQVATWKGPL